MSPDPTGETDEQTDPGTGAKADEDRPSVRQLLHAATGDRNAEAKALADRSDDEVSEEDAKLAVELAHGDVHGEPRPERDVASPEDAKAVDAEGPDNRA